jgi:hypothetical protein
MLRTRNASGAGILRHRPPPRRRAETTGIDRRGARAATPPLGHPVVAVRYVERSRLVVRGPATGRQYEFSAAKPTQIVAAHDADALLRTRYFVRG